MSEQRWEHSMDVRVDKRAQDVLQSFEDALGEPIEMKASSVRDGEYALETESIENLLLVIDRRSITIMDIAARNPGYEDAVPVIQALAETAEQFGYELIAEDVLPERDGWWRRMGFAPRKNDEHSADYVYQPENLS